MPDARIARFPAEASVTGLHRGAPPRDSCHAGGASALWSLGGPGTEKELVDLVNRHLGHARRHSSALTLLSVWVEGDASPGSDTADAAHKAAIAEAGRRLRARMRAHDEVWQTEEQAFVVLLQGGQPAGAVAAQHRLLTVLGGTYRVGSDLITLAARIGIAGYPALDAGAELMLAAAIQARDGAHRGTELRRV